MLKKNVLNFFGVALLCLYCVNGFTSAVGTSASGAPQTNSNCITSAGKVITFYVPHNAPNCRNSMEGCVETSKVGLDGVNKPRCLDDVRNGTAKFVTLASDSSNYGKYFCMGNITYTSALDRQKHTVNNVVGYVHDTGGAFKGRPDKIDVCATICDKCSDGQAGALASGRNIGYIPNGAGAPDSNSSAFNSNGFNNALTGQNNPLTPAGGQSGGSGGSSSGGQPSFGSPTASQYGGGAQQQMPFQPTTPSTQFDTSVEDSNSDAVVTVTCDASTVSWECSEGTRTRGLSKPIDTSFTTKGVLSGSLIVHPKKVTEYKVQCLKNQKIVGQASCVVNPKNKSIKKSTTKKPNITLSVNPHEVSRGGRVTISWAALNVKMCALSGEGVAENGTEGEVESARLTQVGSSDIVLECQNMNGDSVTKRVTISVQ